MPGGSVIRSEVGPVNVFGAKHTRVRALLGRLPSGKFRPEGSKVHPNPCLRVSREKLRGLPFHVLKCTQGDAGGF
jgi:hypothetical protein